MFHEVGKGVRMVWHEKSMTVCAHITVKPHLSHKLLIVGSQTPLCEHHGDCRLGITKSSGPFLARLPANGCPPIFYRAVVCLDFMVSRRDDFRCTTILIKVFSYLNLFAPPASWFEVQNDACQSNFSFIPTSFWLWVLKLASANTMGIAG